MIDWRRVNLVMALLHANGLPVTRKAVARLVGCSAATAGKYAEQAAGWKWDWQTSATTRDDGAGLLDIARHRYEPEHESIQVIYSKAFLYLATLSPDQVRRLMDGLEEVRSCLERWD